MGSQTLALDDRFLNALLYLDHTRNLLRRIPNLNGTTRTLADVTRRLETYAIREFRRQHGRQAVAAVVAAASAKRLGETRRERDGS